MHHPQRNARKSTVIYVTQDQAEIDLACRPRSRLQMDSPVVMLEGETNIALAPEAEFMMRQVACAACGQTHPIDVVALSFRWPDAVSQVWPRRSRCEITSETVILDRARYFIRGLLPLPIKPTTRTYFVGVWAELSAENFGRVMAIWDDDAQYSTPPVPAQLANALPFHENTAGLRLMLQLTGPNTRPDFALLPVEHTLFAEHALGVDEHRAHEYSTWVPRKTVAASTSATAVQEQPDRGSPAPNHTSIVSGARRPAFTGGIAGASSETKRRMNRRSAGDPGASDASTA